MARRSILDWLFGKRISTLREEQQQIGPLAGVPVLGIRAMLSSLAGSPEQQALIQAFWSHRGSERRYTVPPKIKRHPLPISRCAHGGIAA